MVHSYSIMNGIVKNTLECPREEEAKLMYGMVYSLKSFVWKVSPVDLKEGYYCFSSDKYRLHFYESPTKLKMIMTTDLTAQGIKELLHQIYTQKPHRVTLVINKKNCTGKDKHHQFVSIYVEYVVMNPLCTVDKPIESELFSSKLDEMIKQHPSFQSRYS
ncbi:Trafficking protein particle complex subunit 1 [Armadillidium nasatum]|uniref:Trafficking protein particle complex subunit n=1 Tax=Armadillidium nasatum TaxID=96803 RepID=A0A5N5SP95_9CRUS|nr:Trafficking protein particle complex subunit 1 [Armadillidium nasatum]